MQFDTPLRAEHRAFAAQDAARRRERAQQARGALATRGEVEIEYLPFGPADADGGPSCEVVAQYAEVELEYAAIRAGCALVDCCERASLVVRGKDRGDFVNRLVTNEVKKLADGGTVRAFLTNRKGRIDADLVVAAIGDMLVLDTLAHDAAAVREALEKLVFSEDVAFETRAGTHARLGLHGPKAAQALRALGLSAPADGVQAWSAALGDARAEIWRCDELGVEGYALSVPVAQAATVWRSLVTFGARPAGWFATNTARIEAGTPYFRIDFGPNNLPHESGVLGSRVSFTKGCYPGQEVVARMQNLGRPKQRLVGLRMEGDLLPVGDAQVFAFAEGGSIGEQVGVVTSSALAPMLGAAPVAFALVSASHYAEGTKVLVNAEGEQGAATVSALAFLPAEETAG
ncbi:MAG: YgfZ/GcvT domain-containing protein [Planctomycetota bacterium]